MRVQGLFVLFMFLQINVMGQETIKPPHIDKDTIQELIPYSDEIIGQHFYDEAKYPFGNVEMLRHFSQGASPECEVNLETGCILVYLRFDVGADGSISNVKMLRGIEPCFDQVYVQLAKEMPKWIPAMYKDEPLKTTVNLPLQILLD